MNKDRKKIILLKPNGKRMIRYDDWPAKHQKLMKQLKLTVLDAPESKAAELEKELEAGWDERFFRLGGEQPENPQPIENQANPQNPQTETIEQVADEIEPTNGEPETLSLKEAAVYAAMTYQKFTKLVRENAMPTVPGKTPRQKRVLKSDIDKYLQQITE